MRPFIQCRLCWTWLYRCRQCNAWQCDCRTDQGKQHYTENGERYKVRKKVEPVTQLEMVV